MRLLSSALLLSLTLHSAPARSEGPTCERIVVRSPQAGTESQYRATQILDLELEVVFPAELGGDHLLELAFSTPKGHLFTKLTVPVADDVQPGQMRKIEGYPQPVKVVALLPITRDGKPKKLARVRFPVAGTQIVKRGLYGDWIVRAKIDGAPAPCASSSFSLAP